MMDVNGMNDSLYMDNLIESTIMYERTGQMIYESNNHSLLEHKKVSSQTELRQISDGHEDQQRFENNGDSGTQAELQFESQHARIMEDPYSEMEITYDTRELSHEQVIQVASPNQSARVSVDYQRTEFTVEQDAEQHIATEHTDCSRSASGLSQHGEGASNEDGLQEVVIGAVKSLA